jgi:2-iminobutanoate/2-iminopropanoate deaminase
MREAISTPSAPSSPLYSQAVKAGQHIYVSGLVGIDVSTGNLAGLTIQEQTRQALLNCEAILRAAGATMEDVVEVGVLLTNPTDFAGMNDAYATWFPAERPTRYVAKLGVDIPDVLVSIRMTAFVG